MVSIDIVEALRTRRAIGNFVALVIEGIVALLGIITVYVDIDNVGLVEHLGRSIVGSLGAIALGKCHRFGILHNAPRNLMVRASLEGLRRRNFQVAVSSHVGRHRVTRLKSTGLQGCRSRGLQHNGNHSVARDVGNSIARDRGRLTINARHLVAIEGFPAQVSRTAVSHKALAVSLRSLGDLVAIGIHELHRYLVQLVVLAIGHRLLRFVIVGINGHKVRNHHLILGDVGDADREVVAALRGLGEYIGRGIGAIGTGCIGLLHK